LSQPTPRNWCAYCGEKFDSPLEAITVNFEGEELPIHRKEHDIFRERGLLKYKDGPRTGPLSEMGKDLIILVIGISIVLFWLTRGVIW
jgi:hypothetical protein